MGAISRATRDQRICFLIFTFGYVKNSIKHQSRAVKFRLNTCSMRNVLASFIFRLLIAIFATNREDRINLLWQSISSQYDK